MTIRPRRTSVWVVSPIALLLVIATMMVGFRLSSQYHELQDAHAERTHEHRAMRAYCDGFATWIRADDRPGIKAEISSLMTQRVLYCADGAAPDLVARYCTLATSLFEITDPDKFERVVNELGRLQHDIMNVRTWE